MTRGSHEIWREGMLSDMETLHAEKRKLRAEAERLEKRAVRREHEIEQLRRLVDEREADLGRMHGETRAEIERLTLENRQLPQAMTREPDDYFTGACPTCGQAYLRAEIEKLRTAAKVTANVWHESEEKLRAEIEQLKASIAWTLEVHPGKTREGSAVVEMTWDQFNTMRALAAQAMTQLNQAPPSRYK